MKLIDWIKEVKDSYPTPYTTDRLEKMEVRLLMNKERTRCTLVKEIAVCRTCGTKKTQQELDVKFKKAIDGLTIFQACVLWMIFIEHKKPIDYSQYHNCQAGKEFIENIEELKAE